MAENGTDNPDKGQDNSLTKSLSDADDNKKMFIGGISWESTEDDLKEHFEQFGPVSISSIKIDKLSGQSRGFGFIVFEKEDSVDKALAVPEHLISGKKVDPKRAKPQKEPKKKLFVGGIDPDTNEDDIKDYFQKFGIVDKVEWPSDKSTGKRRAYVFVTMTTEDEAKAAAEVNKQNICGRMCDVKIAVPPEQANRQRTWSQYQQAGWGGSGQSYYGGSYDGYDYSGYGAGGYDPYAYDQSYGYGYDYYGGYPPASWQPAAPAPPVGGPPSRGRGAIRGGGGSGGGKIRGSTRGGASQAEGGFHPYSRQ